VNRFSKQVRILVVDDENDIAETLCDFIAMWGGEAKAASGAHAALDILAGESFDIIVSDVSMPGGDGYELIKAVRLKSTTPPKIIMMSGYVEQDRSACQALGVEDIIRKPFNTDVLFETIIKLIQ
jgi:CheY-like chemotaxis protein